MLFLFCQINCNQVKSEEKGKRLATGTGHLMRVIGANHEHEQIGS